MLILMVLVTPVTLVTSAQMVHFDFFYNQLSSEANGFKVAVVGETVTQADGTIDIGVGVDSTTLDLE